MMGAVSLSLPFHARSVDNGGGRGLAMKFSLLALHLLIISMQLPAVEAAPERPTLPNSITIVPVERAKFPKFNGCCNSAKRTYQVPSVAYPTILAALEAAPAKTKIQVAPGTYKENPGNWMALAIERDDICLSGAGPGVTRIVAADDEQRYGMGLTGQRVTMMGLSLEGFLYSVSLGRSDGKTQTGVVLQNVEVIGRAEDRSEGIVSYPDPPGTDIPVSDGLLLANVTVRAVSMGVSCNSGPCHHWWLDKVKIFCTAGGEDGSGADAFAIESGRQIVVTNSIMSGAGADGIDVKGPDVVVWRSKVLKVARNGIKLWNGGDVIASVVDGTCADAALVGESSAKYRYLRSSFSHHCCCNPRQQSYEGTWGYVDDSPGGRWPIDLEISGCTFKDNALSGGLYVPSVQGTRVKLTNNVFCDVGEGEKLVVYGDQVTLVATKNSLQELEGTWKFGSGNQLGGSTC